MYTRADRDVFVGLTITQVKLNKERNVIQFVDDKNKEYTLLCIGDCCSTSWIEHVTGVDNLLNSKIINFSQVDMGDVSGDRDEYEDVVQAYSYKLTTAKGTFEMEMRNESNGYYGGWLELDSDNTSYEWRKVDDRITEVLTEDF